MIKTSTSQELFPNKLFKTIRSLNKLLNKNMGLKNKNLLSFKDNSDVDLLKILNLSWKIMQKLIISLFISMIMSFKRSFPLVKSFK